MIEARPRGELGGDREEPDRDVDPGSEEERADSEDGKPFGALETAHFAFIPGAFRARFDVAYHDRTKERERAGDDPDFAFERCIPPRVSGEHEKFVIAVYGGIEDTAEFRFATELLRELAVHDVRETHDKPQREADIKMVHGERDACGRAEEQARPRHCVRRDPGTFAEAGDRIEKAPEQLRERGGIEPAADRLFGGWFAHPADSLDEGVKFIPVQRKYTLSLE